MNSKLRIRYSKTGDIRFISHLDLIRMIDRTLRRSGLQFQLTKGFSPHYDLSFSAPLPVGIESEAEYFTCQVSDELSLDQIKEKINAACPDGIKILDIDQEKFKDPIMHTYEADLGLKQEELDQKIAYFKENDVIMRVKKKSGDKEVLLNGYVVDLDQRQKTEDKRLVMYFTLKKDEKGAIVSPYVFIKGFMGYSAGEELAVKVKKIMY